MCCLQQVSMQGKQNADRQAKEPIHHKNKKQEKKPPNGDGNIWS